MTDTIVEKQFILALCKCLAISPHRIRKDECTDYFWGCRLGKIYTVAPWWYVYYSVEDEEGVSWNITKKKLSFMTIHQDGDQEGIMKADFPPDEEQAKIIRRVLKIRKSYIPEHLKVKK